MNHRNRLQEDRNQTAAGGGEGYHPQRRTVRRVDRRQGKSDGRHLLTTGKNGADRIVVTAKTYLAKFRDGSGIVREVATGCRDESAARSILGKLERRAEMVKGEVLTAAEDAVIDHQTIPLAVHITDYFDHQRAKGVTVRQIADATARMNRIIPACGFGRLADLSGTALEKWLAAQQADGMGAVTRNAYREAWVAFGNWCVRNHRLLGNPFANVPKADAKADRRRTRRALNEAELTRLLDVARRRPLLDAMTIHRGKHKGEAVGKLREDTRHRLERLGRERALIYKAMVLTGLRKGELASITVGQVDLDAPMPSLVLEAADEKNREGSTIPLRADLVADLRRWLAEKAATHQEAARAAPAVQFDTKHQKRQKRNQDDATGREGQSCLPLTTMPTLPADTPLFTVPAGLVRILDRDLLLAKIPKVDERGRTVDVHALRHTFGTLLSAAGVAPRTAQAAMRHSTIDLTMNVYTDPKLLDVAGAMEALPALPLAIGEVSESVAVRATGTDDSAFCQFAPEFAPTTGKTRTLQSILDKIASEAEKTRPSDSVAVSACPVKRNNPLTTGVNGLRKVEPTGIEPATSWLQIRCPMFLTFHNILLC